MRADGQPRYVGFWARVLASLIDSVLVLLIVTPVVLAVYGRGYFVMPGAFKGPVDILMNIVFPTVAIIAFWVARAATPGKMVIRARIVDADTGGRPSTRQAVLRYLGYYVSLLPCLLGFFWIAFDRRKQGWHDKLAHTLVVYIDKGSA